MTLRINENVLFFALGLAVASSVFLFLMSNNIGVGSGILVADSLAQQPVLLKQDPDVIDETDYKITQLLTDPPEDGDGDDDDEGEDVDVDFIDEESDAMFKHKHENPVSTALKEAVRVFCWIMTSPKNILSKAIHVNATWAPRCNKYVFVASNFTNSTDYDLPIVELEIADGRNTLWGKTKAAYQYIYDNELDNYDWFLKADDDTYVIMENLRLMLLAHDPDDPIYFGCRFKPFTKQGYMSGGSGYVLSREAVKNFVEEGLTNPKHCKKDNGGSEDVEIGKCLDRINVTAGDSRDAKGRHRFLPMSPEAHIKPGNNTMPKWFYQYIYYPYRDGKECCSDYAISWHYVSREWMHTLDNMFYHIKPVGMIDDGFWPQKALTDNTKKELIDKLKDFSRKMSPPV